MGLNEMTEGSGVNLILSKKFGVVGAPAPIMASEVFPQITLQNDRPEWPFLEGDKICGGVESAIGVVGEISHVGLINPIGSGILAIISSIMSETDSDNDRYHIEIGQNITATSTLKRGVPRDTRFEFLRAGGPETTCQLFSLVQVGTILAFRVASMAASASADMVEYDTPIVLGPGGFAMIRANGTDRNVIASIQWIEQKAASGELQGVRQ